MSYLGTQNIQVQGLDTIIRALLYFGDLANRFDWLLLSFNVMASAIKLKNQRKWVNIWENKTSVAIFLFLPWLNSYLYILLELLDHITEFTHNCVLGIPDNVPTGEDLIPFATKNKWMIDKLSDSLFFMRAH